MKIKTKEGEEREMIEMEYSGKPYAIYIVLLLALVATIIGGVYLFAFILDKITKAGVL